MHNQTIILLVIPLVLIHLLLLIINLLNIRKKSTTRYLNKALWIVIMLFIQIIGSIAYMVVEGGHYDSD